MFKDTAFWKALLVRVVIASVQHTIMSPDEVFQGPEVAHRLAFGYGFLTWEWLPGTQIRSALYPSFLAAIFKLLELCRMDSPWMLTSVPVYIQAFIAAVGDYYTYRLARRIYGEETGSWALFLQLTSVWGLMVGTRTFTNYIEAVLFVTALYYWPFPVTAAQEDGIAKDYAVDSMDVYRMKYRHFRRLLKGIAIGLASCALRPTAAIPWVFLGTFLLYFQDTWKSRLYILAIVIPSAAVVALCQVTFDRVVLGDWLFASGKFALENLSVSTLYGISSPIWYFTLGLLVITTTWYPLMLLGIFRSSSHQRLLFWMILFVCAFFSVMVHTEARFVSMIASPCIVYAAYGAHRLCGENVDQENCNSWKNSSNLLPRKSTIKAIIRLLGFINVAIALYFAMFHQSGGISVMKTIREDIDLFQRHPGAFSEERKGITLQNQPWGQFCKNDQAYVPMRVHVWSKCHSTPMFSHVHAPIEIIQLDCSPESRLNRLPLDEQFIHSPYTFLKDVWYGEEPEPAPIPEPACVSTIPMDGQYVGSFDEVQLQQTRPAIDSAKLPKHLPSHVVVPSALEEDVGEFLRQYNYKRADTFPHSHINTDSDAILIIKSFSLYRHPSWQQWHDLAKLAALER